MRRKRWLVVIALGFILGVQDGYIALWKDGCKKPVEVFPFRAQLLPEADQKALDKGIRIDSAGQLAQLMEDYLS